jgi:tRNA threonylcarbamoyladenosine biosynthesis protein TsaB
MKILAFETASGRCSVSLSDKDQILAAALLTTPSQQAEKLMDMVADILKKSNLKPKDINFLVTTNGPGSFTGIRIGLATILGLSMAQNITPIVVSNFAVINFRIREQFRNFDFTATIIDAYRDEFYIQIFDKSNQIIYKGALLSVDNIKNIMDNLSGAVVSSGSGLIKLHTILAPKSYILPRFPTPDARTLCKLAYTQILKENFSSTIEPLYIRPPDCKAHISYPHQK